MGRYVTPRGVIVEVSDEAARIVGYKPAVDVPAPSDLKKTWVDHAVAQGAARADAEALTKAELVEQYG